MASIGKRYKSAIEKIEDRIYTIGEAVEVVSGNANAKFDETLDFVVHLNLDPRHADQMVRGVLKLPAGTGKEVKVAVIANEEGIKAAEKAGADIFGGEELVAEIQAGKTDFDRCIATPDMMQHVGKLGKVLGPKGLMPNPKLGTVTEDVTTAISDAKGGQVEYKVDKNGVVHVGVGKASFEVNALIDNINTVYKEILNAKPSGSKGVYVKSIYLSSTMGPSVKLNGTSFEEKAA